EKLQEPRKKSKSSKGTSGVKVAAIAVGLGAIGLKGSVGKETGITVPALEGFTVGSSLKFEKPEEKK
ncbi:hypothetical protein JDS94_25855, partial [Bacillus cereus]|nr:hypothetical protein [Bacillus cereus]